MKATDVQREVCNEIIAQASFWRDSNDIDSPTHYSDIEECCRVNLEDKLSEKELEELMAELANLFQLVKYLGV